MAMMGSSFRMPFQPYGMEVLTRFTHNHDSPGLREDPKDPKSRHTGWVNHPCGAPDNHLLTVWTGMMPATQGRITDNYGHPPVDSGIYLIKEGKSFWEPGEMLLIKNDPKYNEQWPRPLVPYKRVYGVDEPRRLPNLRNDGKLSKHLPEGTPFGLVGTSSLYKRESFPLGEVPVRRFDKDGKQPLDPDDNPDTSFLAKIPADIAWTFQTLDKDGMVLNMAQTWHQLRPGEIRNNCGGCHAHSQKPTLFKDTAAARPDYVPFDLTRRTPLLTTKQNDQSGKKWDVKDETGLRFAKGVLNVEYHRDVRPILERSCVACHSGKSAKPAGNLVLDDDKRVDG